MTEPVTQSLQSVLSKNEQHLKLMFLVKAEVVMFLLKHIPVMKNRVRRNAVDYFLKT